MVCNNRDLIRIFKWMIVLSVEPVPKKAVVVGDIGEHPRWADMSSDSADGEVTRKALKK